MRTTVTDSGILNQTADGVVIGVPSAKGGTRSKLAGKFAGQLRKVADGGLPKTQSRALVPLEKGPYKHALLCKVDAKSPLDAQGLKELVQGACAQLDGVGCSSVAFDLATLSQGGLDDAAAVRVAAQAAGAADYRFNLGAQKPAKNLRAVVIAVGKKNAAVARAVKMGAAIGTGACLAKHLAEQPPNSLYPAALASAARSAGKQHGLKVQVIDDKQAAKLGMNGLLAVGRGSDRKPRLIIIRHYGGKRGAAPVALVGKGVTFDTGGYSLKPGNYMMDMKFDMCGAAGVLGAMVACARMKLPLNVAAVIPTVENMVSGDAYRPDDIIKMMDGQLVEVLNTDAEGRIILADALTYTQRKIKPKEIIDAATLTGACLVALGQHRCGMFATSDELGDALHGAGEESGDLCWRLPMDDAYDAMLKSKVADMQNIGGGGKAGTITAACFLKRFVKDVSWAHLDIAGSAWQERRASGRPVPLLATYLARKAKMLG